MAKAGQRPSQKAPRAEPPEGSTAEARPPLEAHRQLQALMAALERGELPPERVVRTILAQFQLGIGGSVRALGEIDPSTARNVALQLRQRLEAILREIDSMELPGEGEPAAEQQPIAARLKDKRLTVLERERAVLEKIDKTDQTFALRDLKALVIEAEPKLSDATLAANLDRLQAEHVIARPRKGHYARTAATRDYLYAVKAEIAARSR